jgi:hypothetical protein
MSDIKESHDRIVSCLSSQPFVLDSQTVSRYEHHGKAPMDGTKLIIRGASHSVGQPPPIVCDRRDHPNLQHVRRSVGTHLCKRNITAGTRTTTMCDTTRLYVVCCALPGRWEAYNGEPESLMPIAWEKLPNSTASLRCQFVCMHDIQYRVDMLHVCMQVGHVGKQVT